ncbi:glucosyltransferase domain-containing protein [Erwinia amylovora]|uniref:glucosyltransferase domain-containing protein n=1 Tax=Erwinia amylovora TaxID=552 RepID=UPI00144470E1|nr:glucosyltransferase domain-containing protein [Erwinia amylovora]
MPATLSLPHEPQRTDGNLRIYFTYFVIILVAYSPTYMYTYAFSDDWAIFYSVFHSNNELLKWDVTSGRPLYGFLKIISLSLLQYVSGFQIIRFIAVAALALLCCYVYRKINSRKIIDGEYERIVFPLLICLLPSFQVYTAWAICSPFVFSVALSGLSYFTLIDAEGKTSLPKMALSLALLFASFAIYQPSAMSFLFFVFLDNCIRKRELTLKRLIICGSVISLGMLWALCLSKLIPQLVYQDAISRTELADNVVEKILWFINEPLINAICNFNLKTKLGYRIISGVFIFVGLYEISKQKHGVLKVALTLVLAIACYTPNLVVKESWGAYRTLVALEMIVSSLFLLGIFSLVKRFKLQRYMYPLMAITCVYLTFSNIKEGFALPQKMELQALSDEIKTKVPKSFDGKLMFDISKQDNISFSKINKYDEFGLTSMRIAWAVPGMAQAIKKNMNMRYSLEGNTILSKNNSCNENCIVLDVGKVTPAPAP